MELTAKLIISYINSARFPDVEDVYKFNHIKFYLSAEMDEEIKSQFRDQRVIYSSHNYFARNKVNTLLIKRKCYNTIRYLLEIDQFIWSTVHNDQDLFSLVRLLSETGDKNKLSLTLLNTPHVAIYYELLTLYHEIYDIKTISDYVKSTGNKKLIKALSLWPKWKAFDSSLRKCWIESVIVIELILL
jgi:hypothetical protein